jgi:hypothetical protein
MQTLDIKGLRYDNRSSVSSMIERQKNNKERNNNQIYLGSKSLDGEGLLKERIREKDEINSGK